MLSFPVLVLDLVISYLKLKDRLSLSLTSKSLVLELLKTKSRLVVDLGVKTFKFYSETISKRELVTVNGRGLREGITKILNVSGKEEIPISIQDYSKGKKHGKYIKFFPDGKKYLEKIFDMDKLTGDSTHYYPSGEIKLRSIPLDDGNCITTTYYPEGHIASIKPSKNGEHVMFDRISPSLVRYSVNYVDGLKDGYELEFDLYGKLHRKIFYVKGLKEGKEEVFLPDGSYSTVNYVNGKRHGEFVQTIPRKGNFLQKSPKPLILIKCTYIEGKLEGVYRSFFRDGKPHQVRHYLNDKLYGDVTIHRFDGTYKESFPSDKGSPYNGGSRSRCLKYKECNGVQSNIQYNHINSRVIVTPPRFDVKYNGIQELLHPPEYLDPYLDLS